MLTGIHDAVLIYNPRAGRGGKKRRHALEKAQQILRDAGIEAELQATAGPRAATELANFGPTLKEISYAYITPPKDLRAGRSVTLAVTSPMSITGTFQIQTVTTRPRLDISGQTVDVWRTVTASPLFRRFTDVIKKV